MKITTIIKAQEVINKLRKNVKKEQDAKYFQRDKAESYKEQLNYMIDNQLDLVSSIEQVKEDYTNILEDNKSLQKAISSEMVKIVHLGKSNVRLTKELAEYQHWSWFFGLLSLTFFLYITYTTWIIQ